MLPSQLCDVLDWKVDGLYFEVNIFSVAFMVKRIFRNLVYMADHSLTAEDVACFSAVESLSDASLEEYVKEFEEDKF